MIKSVLIDDTNLPDDPAKLIAEVARRINRKPTDVIGPRKFDELVAARRLIARRLQARGWNDARIGRELRKDRSTIYTLLHGKKVRRLEETATPPSVPATPSPVSSLGAGGTPS